MSRFVRIGNNVVHIPSLANVSISTTCTGAPYLCLYYHNQTHKTINYGWSNYDECEKDNLLIFNSNNTYVISEGATACSPTTTESGNWNLNQSVITINSELGTVTDFSCSCMKIKKVYGAEETTIILAKQ